MYFNDTNTYQESSYTTADLKIGYLFDGWDIYAYANNITDESYLTAANNMMTGTVLAYGEGRFIGIGAKYRF
jgi:iron complex outermembrane receptor protein